MKKRKSSFGKKLVTIVCVFLFAIWFLIWWFVR